MAANPLRWLAGRTGDITLFPRFLCRGKGHQFFRPYVFSPSTIRIMILIGGFGTHKIDRGNGSRRFGLCVFLLG